MSRRRDLATIALVLLLLTGGAVADIAGPSHSATAGVTYETNSGVAVELGDDREVEAVPFADDQTFASQGIEIEGGGSGAVRVPNAAFDGSTMAVRDIDASTTPLTFRRDDLSSDVTVSGGATDVILHDATLDDGSTDIEVVADSQTTISFDGLASVGAIKAVDPNGDSVASAPSADGDLTLPAGQYDLRLREGPDTLFIRDLTTRELVNETATGDPLNVEVSFFGDDGAVERRNTTDGTIDMSGLPTDQRFAVSVDAGGNYTQRQAIIPSLLNQQTVWLLPDGPDIPTVEPRFTLEDPSNQFDSEQSEIILKRPLETENGTEFVAVAGDRVGLNGFDPVLERDQRYRVVVRDPDSGAQRELGEFTPTATESVTLTVQDVVFDSVSDVDGVEWTARYSTVDQGADEIEFIFRSAYDTQSVDYRIVERGNDSNVLLDASATGNVTVTEPVPPSQENTVWRVEWNASTQDSGTLSGSRVVSSSRLPVGPALGDRWQTAVSMLSLIVVAGLFGAANPGVGGIAVAGTGGVFFVLGWLPDSTGGLMVVLAMFIAVLAYAGRKARGAAV